MTLWSPKTPQLSEYYFVIMITLVRPTTHTLLYLYPLSLLVYTYIFSFYKFIFCYFFHLECTVKPSCGDNFVRIKCVMMLMFSSFASDSSALYDIILGITRSRIHVSHSSHRIRCGAGVGLESNEALSSSSLLSACVAGDCHPHSTPRRLILSRHLSRYEPAANYGLSLIASNRRRSRNNDEFSSWSSVSITSMAFPAKTT